MATQQLQRAEWQPYFDRVSRTLGGELAEIETAGLPIGDQVNQEWTPLNGLAYDPKDDVFEIVTETLDHLIYHPQQIYVDEAGPALRSVDVVDADGNHQIVRLKQPLTLPAP